VTSGARRAATAVLAFALAVTPAACGRRTGPPVAQPSSPVSTALTAAPATPGGTAPPPAPSPTAAAPAPSPTAPGRTPSATGFPARYLGKDLEQIPTSRTLVALTFDAGANADGVASILATLARERVSATFFLTGEFTADFPQAARSIAGAGHRIGNHTATHPHLPGLTDARVRSEVLTAAQTIRGTTGKDPRPFFRFPYGDTSAHTIALVNAQGYLAVRWTVDTLGWQGTTGGRSAASVTQRALAAARPGEIVLMHVGSHPTDRSTLDADALPAVIAGLRQRGYTFVTLDVLLTG
jgi:peptidoglycan/xylan/chitin deacetylase (PgdA/CDA1 family)